MTLAPIRLLRCLRQALFLLPLTLCLLASANAQPVVQLVSADLPPWFGPGLPQGGALTQIVSQAWRRQGYTVNIQYLPWARALAELRDGKFDAMIALPQQEADPALLYSQALTQWQYVFFKQQGRQLQWQDVSELGQYRIGVVRGYPLPGNLQGLPLKLSDSTDDTTSLRKLALGRVDLVLAERHSGHWLIDHRLAESRIALDWQGSVVASSSQHLAFSRKRGNARQYLQAFNQGLQQMQQDGSLQAILHQAGLDVDRAL